MASVFVAQYDDSASATATATATSTSVVYDAAPLSGSKKERRTKVVQKVRCFELCCGLALLYDWARRFSHSSVVHRHVMRCYGTGLFQIKEVVKLFDRLGSSTGMAMGQIENEDAMLQALIPAPDALIEQCHVSEEDLVDDDADDEGVKPPKPKRAMTLAYSGEQLHQVVFCFCIV